MKLRQASVIAVLALVSSFAFAQQSKPAGVLAATDLKTLVPASYFYRGQSASVQMRNTAGIRTKDEKYVLAGLVDTSGYSSGIQQKYQGFFITEVKLKVGDHELVPGEYGFGFVDNKFLITDVGANDLFSTSATNDTELKRPVPLKISEDGGNYRLYAGRKYVTLNVE